MPDERVGHDLERRAPRTARRRTGLAGDSSWPFGSLPLTGGTSSGRGQVIHHRVEQRLDALVLERRAAQHREQLPRDAALAEAARQLVLGDGPGRRGTSPSPASSCSAAASISCARGALRLVQRASAGISAISIAGSPSSDSSKMMRLHPHQVDDALELLLHAQAASGRAPALAPSFSLMVSTDIVEVGADAVHLVDEADARDAVLVRLPPDRLGLRLDAVRRASKTATAPSSTRSERSTSMVKSTCPGVSMMLMRYADRCGPEGGDGGGGDGDAALALLHHPVHGGVPSGPRPSCGWRRCRTGSARWWSSSRRRCAP